MIWYILSIVALIVTSVMLLHRLKKRQYLYYKDHKVKIRVQALGMIVFICMNIWHVFLKVKADFAKGHDAMWWMSITMASDFDYLSYEGVEILACIVIVASKTNEYSCSLPLFLLLQLGSSPVF